MNFIEVRGHACTFGKHGILECAISHGAQESTIYGSGHARSKKIKSTIFLHIEKEGYLCTNLSGTTKCQ
jgi:hypothetical protein